MHYNTPGLSAVLAVKPINTTVPIKAHKKYSYQLRDLEITHANHVWPTDITYCKTARGMVYWAAIIDWHSKAVLSHKVSNTMDTQLVMDVLNEALSKHGKPKIFNTDQGSQYTSELHTQRLKNLDICISMDGIGRATDNICMERFWRSAKIGLLFSLVITVLIMHSHTSDRPQSKYVAYGLIIADIPHLQYQFKVFYNNSFIRH